MNIPYPFGKKLLLYSPPRREVLGDWVQQIAENAKVHKGIVRIRTYEEFDDLLSRGLPEIARIMAIYGREEVAVKIMKEASWLGDKAIMGIYSRAQFDEIRSDLDMSWVYVFGIGSDYLPKYTPEWFLRRRIKKGYHLT